MMMLVKKENRRNCIKNLQPILALCSIFGACTLSNSLKLSWWKTGFSIAVIILGILHLILIPSVTKHKEQMSSTKPENFTLDEITFDITTPNFITKMANPMATSIASLFYRLYAVFIFHKKFPELIKRLELIDRLLNPPQTHHKSDSKRLTFYIVFIVTIFPLQLYTIWLGLNPYLAFYLIGLCNNYALECTEFLFTSFCYLIESRFKHINKKLQQHKQPKQTIHTICKTVDTLRESTPKGNYEDLIVANEIQTLRRAFQKLVRLSEMLNNQFNIRLLAALGVCTFNVLTNLYMGLFGEFIIQTVVTSLLWACYYFVRLIWISVACEFLVKEANDVKGSLSDILNRNWGRLTKEEIWIFLGVLQTTEVKFTACGFFTIDFTLITATVATGATYLVVLAQFHKG